MSARHIVSLSGGKDSTALAIYLRNRISELEYVFCDTGEELPETYEYLDKIEKFLGKEIKRLKSRKSFRELLYKRKGFLPSSQARWCTRELKIEPFEEYVGDDLCYNYIGIRADEPHRKGYISTKPNITAKYPFIEDGITKPDVLRILEESGIGLPDYYKWRSRSGCYFCFFQQKNEWIGLLHNHPDLYDKSQMYEKENRETGERYTWSPKESLIEMRTPERIKEIIANFQRRKIDNDDSCLICHL